MFFIHFSSHFSQRCFQFREHCRCITCCPRKMPSTRDKFTHFFEIIVSIYSATLCWISSKSSAPLKSFCFIASIRAPKWSLDSDWPFNTVLHVTCKRKPMRAKSMCNSLCLAKNRFVSLANWLMNQKLVDIMSVLLIAWVWQRSYIKRLIFCSTMNMAKKSHHW